MTTFASYFAHLAASSLFFFRFITIVKQADVGVALLSGFGDVNVDRGEDGKKKETPKSAALADPSLNITVLSPQERLAARKGPVWALKAKLLALGVDLNKYPELTEKEDLIKLYEIRGREKAIQNKKAAEAKQKAAEAKAKQRELVQEKQLKMAQRVQELEAQVSYVGHDVSCHMNRTWTHYLHKIYLSISRVCNGRNLRHSKNSWQKRRHLREKSKLIWHQRTR